MSSALPSSLTPEVGPAPLFSMFSYLSTSWPTIIITLLLGLLSLRLLLGYLFSNILPSLQVGQVGFFSLRNIAWRSPSKKVGGSDSLGLRVTVSQLGWSLLGSRKCVAGWFILKAEGVRILIPRAALLGKPRSRRNSTASNSSNRSTFSSSSSPAPDTPFSLSSYAPESLRPLASCITRTLSRPLSSIFNYVTSHLSIFALEIGFSIEVEGVCLVEGILTAGIQSTQGSGSRIGAWVGLEKLRISEAGAVKGLSGLSMKERMVISGSAPLDPTSGVEGLVRTRGNCYIPTRASLEVDVRFEGEKGVHLRYHEIGEIAERIQDLLREKKGWSSLADGDERQFEYGDVEEDLASSPLSNPLNYLRSLSLSLPRIVVSAHYTTPSEIIAVCPDRPLPRSVGFVVTIKGIEGNVVMGGTTGEADIKREHLEWFGKNCDLGIRAKFGWEGVEGRVKVDGSEEDILPDSAKAFSLGESSVLLTSTWLPARFASGLACSPLIPRSSCPSARNFNDDTVVIETFIGQLRSHATFEILDSALRIVQARPLPDRRSSNINDGEETRIITGLPRIIGTLETVGFEVRIQGPARSRQEATTDEYGQFYRSWRSPDLFCISLPNGVVSFGGEYQDRSLRRSDADRRIMKRLSRVRTELPAASEANDSPKLDGKLDEALGALPRPPTIHPAYRTHQVKQSESVDTDLIDYPLEYKTRLELHSEIINVYLLASDQSSGDLTDVTSWLNDSSVLAVDPNRFDILAFGPFGLGACNSLRGSESTPTESTPSNALLDLATHSGELSVWVGTIGLDLWRPSVMGSLSDLLTSFASAEATAPIRRPSTSPQSLRPLVDRLPLEMAIYVSVASLDFRIAGSDPKTGDRVCRGIAGHSGGVIFDFLLQDSIHPGVVRYPHRQSLDLREDIRVEANANAAQNPGVRQALFKVTMNAFHLDPVTNARDSKGQTSGVPVVNQDEPIPNDWESKRIHTSMIVKRRRSIIPTRMKEASKGMINCPEIAIRVKISAASDIRQDQTSPLDVIITTIEADTITCRVSLFHIYVCLLAFTAVKTLIPKIPRSPASTVSLGRRPAPDLQLRFELSALHIFLELPNAIKLFLNTRRLRLQYSRKIGLLAEWDMLLVAGESPVPSPQMEDLLRLRIGSISARESPDGAGLILALSVEATRLRIPFKYLLSKVIDNAVNLAKTVKQLLHQLVRGELDYVLRPDAEEAKKLPTLRFNTKVLAIEIQDDPFEAKLNKIWRAGCEEQNARLERRAAFDEKVEAIKRMDSEAEEDAESVSRDSHSAGTRHPKVTGQHSVGIEEARQSLQAYDSTNWIKRIRNATAEQGRREEALARRLYGILRHQERLDPDLPIEMFATRTDSPLSRITLHNVHLLVTQPSFPLTQLPYFLHEVGKGLPLDTKFTLLVPLHLSCKMSEARCQIRDYPLPLLHIPPVSAGAGESMPSFEWESDVVVAEEVGGPDSIRKASCVIVPPLIKRGKPVYTVVIPRTAMTVKSYATPIVKINTSYATRIGWGNSIQPAISDIAKVLETLTKASPDPSERIGFWDKIRLQFHWRIKVLFQGTGPVHFHIKGTRDPYALTGVGAGFSKAWRGNIKMLVGFPNPDREFFQVESDEYILGIPNLRDYLDSAATGLARDPSESDDKSMHSSSFSGDPTGRNRLRQEADFVKVCAKFINGVRWGVGTVLERVCLPNCMEELCRGKGPFHRQCRFFDFRPHWEVHTKNAESVRKLDGLISDSFAGFRSDYIHLSISLTSPLTLKLPSSSSSTLDPDDGYNERGYNSLHFSPQAATHFWAWWSLFDGSMSLPIRQGALFPSEQPPSKKFGKHCATIKYRASLAPLFISHAYRQESWNEWANGETTLVGLKGKVGRFNIDMHQREQEETVRKPNSEQTKTIRRKAFCFAEIDCDGVDLRVVSAVFQEPEKQDAMPENIDAELDEDTLPAKDYSFDAELHPWIDLDDYVDAIYTIPDQTPRARVIPFIVCPRFTYTRQADPRKELEQDGEDSSNVPTSVASNRSRSKFGVEPSHTCLMGSAIDTMTAQILSARARLAELEEAASSTPLKSKDGPKSEVLLRIAAVQRIIHRLLQIQAGAESVPESPNKTRTPEDQSDDQHLPHITSELYQEAGDWDNRYVIHNPTIQISNATRDVLLKYYYASRDRRGFVYHLSASAIKFIRDLTKRHAREDPTAGSRQKRGGAKFDSKKTSTMEDAQMTSRLLDELANGNGNSFWAASESKESGVDPFGHGLDVHADTVVETLPDSFESQAGHLCMFIKPQIALQSDADDKSTIILTAFRAQLKVYSVIDTRIPDDPVNAQVLHQTFAVLDGLQAFYPREQNRVVGGGLIFVPLETLVDLRVEPWGFDRVVPRTAAALRYDKFNQLRIGSKGTASGILGPGTSESHLQSGTDRIAVECEKFSVSANPDHFAAIYNVVTDLLLYSDPLQKSKSKQLEEIVFTRDFSDLTHAIDIVKSLQSRLRAISDLGQEYQVHLDQLDEEGRLELFHGRAEFVRLSNELNLVVQAITRAQVFNGASTAGTTAGIQFEARAFELVWHMLDKSDIPFAKFSVDGVEFSWTSKQDSSISNRLVIKDLKTLNSSPDHVFTEIIAKSEEVADHELARADVFAAILWNSLPPVGGISIVEQFEVHLHPIRLQLEHRVGRQILDYIFAQRRKLADDEPAAEKKHPTKVSRPNPTPLSSSANSFMHSTDSLSIHKNNSRLTLSSDIASRSTLDVPSTASFSALRRVNSSTTELLEEGLEEGLDGDEMRLRAALFRTFILVEFTSTVLSLSYRSEKGDHSRLPDVYNITYRTPSVQYRGKTWSFLDLLDELKKDVIKSVWSQKTALIGQLLSTAHRKLPMPAQREKVKKSLTDSIKNRFNIGKGQPQNKSDLRIPSPLRLTVQGSSSSRPVSINQVSLYSSSDEDLPEDEGIDPSSYESIAGPRLTAEPETMSVSSSSGYGTDATTKATSLPARHDDRVPVPPTPEHAASLPAVGYPSHVPLGRIKSQHTDADKLEMLWGKS